MIEVIIAGAVAGAIAGASVPILIWMFAVRIGERRARKESKS